MVKLSRCLGGILGIALLSVSCFAAKPAPAPENVGWRFWTAFEGLTEAYTTTVTALPSGRLAVRHGDVATFDILDGFGVRAVADQHWLGRVYEDNDGTLYTFNARGIATFQKGSWINSPIPELDAIPTLKKLEYRLSFSYANRRRLVAEDSAGVVPVGPGRALILVPGRILEWKRGAGTRLIRSVDQTGLGEFRDLRQAGAGSAWLMGKLGFAQISLRDPRGSLYDWAEVHPDISGLHSFTLPIEQAEGRIFVTAQKADGTRVALSLAGEHASIVASVSGPASRLWPGTDAQVWKTDGRTLGYMDGNRYRELRASPELAGEIFDVLPERQGSFWLATSQKLAHYTPPLWREPAGAPPMERLVNSIAEDARGRMWFSADRELLMMDRGVWRSYPLPAGDEYRIADTKAVNVLSDGNILLDVEAEDYRLIFDVATASFRRFSRGPGQLLGLIVPRRAGGLWVGSYPPASASFRFEIMEGGVYRSVPGLDRIPMSEPRDLLEARNGDIWIATTSYLARVHNGQLRVLKATDGFADSGAYSLAEMPDGAIFIGGRNGVTVWDGTRFGPLQTGVDRARSIAQSRDGTLWVASGTGVHRFTKGEWIGNSAEDGLPGAGYKVFFDSKGGLWAGTTFGLRLFHPEGDTDPPVTAISEDRNLRKTPPVAMSA